MSRHLKVIRKEMGRLAEDTRGLLAATADLAGDGIAGIRTGIAAELKRDGKIFDRVRDRGTALTGAADEAMHRRPYRVAAVGIGCGAVAGFLIARQFFRHRG
jgi:ElaB/YqjD/DUF883 family membrane-anchored ribosome-binding protein